VNGALLVARPALFEDEYAPQRRNGVDEAALAEATLNAGVPLLTDPILPRLRVAAVAFFLELVAPAFKGWSPSLFI